MVMISERNLKLLHDFHFIEIANFRISITVEIDFKITMHYL